VTNRIDVDGDRLSRLLREANQFGALATGGVQRPAWSDAEVAARAWLLDRCQRKVWKQTRTRPETSGPGEENSQPS